MADFTTTKVNGNTVAASEWNQLADIDNSISSTGQAPSTGDLNQLGKTMADYAAVSTFYTDSGAANAYVLTPIGSFQASHAYTNGMLIRFRAGNAGTGGVATVNVNSLGVKSLKESDGTTNPLSIPTTEDTEWRYDGTVFRRSSTNPSSYALLTYAVSSGTDGGANAAGAWTTRPINTENYDSNNIVSLSANQFTLVAGTYLIESRSVFYTELNTLVFCKSRIRNIDDSLTLIVGESIYADTASGSSVAPVSATPKTLFTIASSKTFELQYYCGTVNAADGLGRPTSTGENEVYASIFIQKL